jgi:hypothetical protein
VLDRYPSIPGVEAAFAAAGFAATGCEPVPQKTASSVADAAAALQREAHTPPQWISDEAYAAGVARLREAAPTESGPLVSDGGRKRNPPGRRPGGFVIVEGQLQPEVLPQPSQT